MSVNNNNASSDRALTSTLIDRLPILRDDGSNRQVWKIRVESILKHKKLWEYVITQPSSGRSRDSLGSPVKFINEKKEVDPKCQEAYALLIACLDDTLVSMFAYVEQGNVFQLWNKINDYFAKQSLSTQTRLRDELSKCKLRVGVKFEQFHRRFTQLVLELESAGVKLTDQEQLVYMYNALPTQLSHLKHTYKHLNVEYDTVVEAIRDAVNDLIASEDGGSALSAEGNNNPYCRICEQVGHTTKRCRFNKLNGGFRDIGQNKSKSGKVSDNGNNNSARKCYICDKVGHFKAQCPLKDRVKSMAMSIISRDVSPDGEVRDIAD